MAMRFAQERSQPRHPGRTNQPDHPLALVGLERLFDQATVEHKHRVTRLTRTIECLPGAKPHREDEGPLCRPRGRWQAFTRITRPGHGRPTPDRRRFPCTHPAPLTQRHRRVRRPAPI